jgi:protein phosphatase
MRIEINVPVGFYEIGTRAKQEDAIYPQLGILSTGNRVFVVCDGLGGHDYGEVASNIVASALGAWVELNVSDDTPMTEQMARAAVAYAQQQLNEAARQHPSSKPMGTTMTMLVLGNNGVVAAHIGDSRIYHVRPSEGAILYRSRDHSLVNDLFVMGRLTREETEASPKKNILTRAMMAAPAPVAQPDVALITDVEAGDYFLLCSDGVCGEITDEKILEALMRSDTGDNMKLAAMQVMAKDGRDNRTAILVRVERVIHEPGETLLVANEQAKCDKMVPLSMRLQKAPEVKSVHEPEGDNLSTVVPPIPVQAQGEVSETPAAVASTGLEEPLPETGYVTGGEEVHYNYNKPKKNNNRVWKRAGLILLTALLLAAGITTYFMTKKPSVEPPAPEPTADTLAADPDVSVDSMLPPMPGDTLAVGTDVAVPRAPGIGNVPLPDTSLPTPSPSSNKGNYPTGSGVKVPRAPRYNGNNIPPYDPYEGTENFGSDEPIHDYAPGSNDDRDLSPRASEPAPAPKATTPPPPRKQQASDDPARSNRNVAVPLPSGRSSNRPIETP